MSTGGTAAKIKQKPGLLMILRKEKLQLYRRNLARSLKESETAEAELKVALNVVEKVKNHL